MARGAGGGRGFLVVSLGTSPEFVPLGSIQVAGRDRGTPSLSLLRHSLDGFGPLFLLLLLLLFVFVFWGLCFPLPLQPREEVGPREKRVTWHLLIW